MFEYWYHVLGSLHQRLLQILVRGPFFGQLKATFTNSQTIYSLVEKIGPPQPLTETLFPSSKCLLAVRFGIYAGESSTYIQHQESSLGAFYLRQKTGKQFYMLMNSPPLQRLCRTKGKNLFSANVFFQTKFLLKK